MTPVAIGLLALTLSLDSFVVALSRGAAHRDMPEKGQIGVALRMGAVFGLVEALTPLIGWAMGMAAAQYVQMVDHWIAFGLLSGVGLRMVLAARHQPQSPLRSATFAGLLIAALGTSVDAMAVGVSLAFVPVNIFVVAAAVGCFTAVLSGVGILCGRYLGQRIGPMAEAAGGVILICLGTVILVSHLTA
ncbi:manganese efflux pump MntP family protein [Pseudooceanicola sp. HF7]|uniref:manganese efflux pump MntP n=1 Tax=Pseudooceanicola sp. HF7 TaxID=2721560 RepID=UPI00142F8006|nr:manganese efflux pump MntP family protein [Pseudooceanicola sp. HF7]NIZ10353.1 manganese efflux pump [Pseudooceanicola sp. HF7]